MDRERVVLMRVKETPQGLECGFKRDDGIFAYVFLPRALSDEAIEAAWAHASDQYDHWDEYPWLRGRGLFARYKGGRVVAVNYDTMTVTVEMEDGRRRTVDCNAEPAPG